MSASSIFVDKPRARASSALAIPILAAISFCHLLNDMMQSLISSIYPILKASFHLDFAHLGIISLTYQVTASLFQPVIGSYTDKHPKPYSLVFGMGSTLVGLLLLSVAGRFALLLIAAGLIGLGSSVFHPESSRVARLASGGQHGLAQSVFQVGGNAGSALGPLVAALVVLPGGQRSIAWFSLVAILAMFLLSRVGGWYKNFAHARKSAHFHATQPLSPRILAALGILIVLVFSKFFYLASLSNYYTFYLMDRFHVSVRDAQMHLFLFLGAVALGTVLGGPIGDRIGRKRVIWVSILGVLPFSLLLPNVNLFWTSVLSVPIGFILASAFSAIVVYAQELVPGRVGLVSGLFFGLAFGMGGLGAALLGLLADHTSIFTVYRLCAFLPALGILTAFLPDTSKMHAEPLVLAE